MTSELEGAKEVDPAPAIPEEAPACLCCLHFAVDLDSMPEAVKHKRPTRHPKRHHVEL